MEKKIILEMEGNLNEGFIVSIKIPRVNQHFSKFEEVSGKLPPNLQIKDFLTSSQHIRSPQEIHRETDDDWGINNDRPTNYSSSEHNYSYHDQNNWLKDELNQWLQSSTDEGYQEVISRLKNKLTDKSTELCLCIALSESNAELLKLPWNEWDLVKSTNVGVAHAFLSTNEELKPLKTNNKLVRILVVLGCCDNINVEQDLQVMKKLGLEPRVLKLPAKRQLIEELENQEGWDIFYFAGHSETTNGTSQIHINKKCELEISWLKNAFEKAHNYGLRLAIFNSCDGLGIAKQLDQLCIPIIVMAGRMPDEAAHTFVKKFFREYCSGKPLSISVRIATERLKEFPDLPGVDSLPKLFHSPNLISQTRQEPSYQRQSKRDTSNIIKQLVMLFFMSLISSAFYQIPSFDIPNNLSSILQHTCKNYSITEKNVSADCLAPDGRYKRVNIDISGIQNNNGYLMVSSSDIPNTFQHTCKNYYIFKYYISAACQALDGRYKRTSIDVSSI